MYKEILAMVMAGGKGERLYPLTLERTKPSVPFGGKYRIIDFALSNLINSGIYSIYVLVQYKSQSLIEHLRTTWLKKGILPYHFVTVVPPQMRREKKWYKGTADSVYQNINLIYDFKPKLVAIFAGDHIYQMNISEMVKWHLKRKADLTISVVSIDKNEASQFGVIEFDKNFRIKKFQEKPIDLKISKPFVSMGNYIFNTEFLVDVLEEDSKRDTSHDFGKDIIPYLVKKKARIYAYDFSWNKIPFSKGSQNYWKDVGTIKSYWQANMDLLGEKPKLRLDNKYWPIYASNLDLPPAYVLNSEIKDSFICEGCKIYNSKISNSILGRAVVIEDSLIEDSIIMDFTQVKKNTKIRKAIIDRFNIVEKNTHIGYNREIDGKKYYVDLSGIVVLKRGSRKQ